jgi:hypothetical protein
MTAADCGQAAAIAFKKHQALQRVNWQAHGARQIISLIPDALRDRRYGPVTKVQKETRDVYAQTRFDPQAPATQASSGQAFAEVTGSAIDASRR